MAKNKAQQGFSKVGQSIGVGLLAGLAGTAAITISQIIEMKITERKPSMGPANAVEKTLDIHPEPGTKERFSQEVHWTYGSLWGVVRGLLSVTGMNCWIATGVHFAAITTTAMAMSPLEGEKPVTEWSGKEIATTVLHHAVYSLAAGLVYDMIAGEE